MNQDCEIERPLVNISTSFLVDLSASISNGSIIRSLRALRR